MRAFGARAVRWSSALPNDLPVIAVDEHGIADAYLAAVEHRTRAEPFFLRICIPDHRAAMAMQIAHTLANSGSYDHQRVLFTQLAEGTLMVNGARVDTLTSALADRARVPLAEMLRLSDGLFATSHSEATRIRTYYSVDKAAVAVGAAPHPGIPAFHASGRGKWIVVWANGTPIVETALVSHALFEQRLPVFVVAANGEVFCKPGLVPPPNVATLLGDASLIVDTAIGDPADALALAAGGVPLAVTRTAGAAEYIDGAIAYDPWNWRSLYDAVARGLGEAAPRVHALGAQLDGARATIARAVELPPDDGPLVSVIIPTYNRRERLPNALRSIFTQRYRNLEVIVVNDGGAAVDDIVAQFPAARLISYQQNGGVEHAINTGYAAAGGAYVTHVSDDDAFYPDHIARLVDACERSGCAIAHGNTVMRFLRQNGDDVELEGFSANVFMFPLEKTEANWTSPVAGHSFIIRADVGRTLGWYDESLAVLGDQEMQTRYAKEFDFVHVDHATCEWRFTGGEENLSTRKAQAVPGAMRAWFAAHPSDRPLVNAARENSIASVESRPPGFRFPPTITFPPGTPAFQAPAETLGSVASSRK
jgi:hypothetical protein